MRMAWAVGGWGDWRGWRVLLPVLVVVLAGAGCPGGARAIEIQRVVSPGGIEAWLVADPKIPVIAVEFAFRNAGAAVDPAGMDGLATLTSDLLDEGAGELDSQEFQRQLDDRAISLSFSAGRDSLSGSLRTLSRHRAEAFHLTNLALTRPRFDAEAVERQRNLLLANYKRDLNSPMHLASRAYFKAVFPDHPYGQEAAGNPESLARITVDDLKGFAASRLGLDQLLIAVCGDITPEQLGPALDQLFGGLPAHSASAKVADVTPAAAGATVVVERPTAQSVLLVGTEAVARSDPDWFAAFVLNRVLGGSGFDSRLMNEIRVKRGLTYGIYGQLLPMDHAALMLVSGSTVNAKAGEVLSLIRAEWEKLRDHGITAEELADAKTYLTGNLALQFTSTAAIAGIVLQVRRDRLGIDYLDRRSGLIEAVTLEDVQRVARRLLDPARLTTVIVGQPEGLASGTTGPGRS